MLPKELMYLLYLGDVSELVSCKSFLYHLKNTFDEIIDVNM